MDRGRRHGSIIAQRRTDQGYIRGEIPRASNTLIRKVSAITDTHGPGSSLTLERWTGRLYRRYNRG